MKYKFDFWKHFLEYVFRKDFSDVNFSFQKMFFESQF